MIPLELQDGLVERLESVFENFQLKNLQNEEAIINIFSQHLPAKDKSRTDPYPCIIVRLADSDQPDRNEASNVTVQFIIGVVDRESSFQGYRDSVTVANRIIENLNRQPFVDGKYELEMPITWAYHDEDAEPYFFSGIETSWRAPKYIREDVEGMI